jgi:hypothetical protein
MGFPGDRPARVDQFGEVLCVIIGKGTGSKALPDGAGQGIESAHGRVADRVCDLLDEGHDLSSPPARRVRHSGKPLSFGEITSPLTGGRFVGLDHVAKH